MKFSEICTFAVIYAAYMAARRGKRSRAATAHYEVRLLENIVNLVYILKTKIYRPGVFRVFYVYEPKKRLVQAPAFVDKVVQHAIVDNLLYDRITRSFILDNYASNTMAATWMTFSSSTRTRNTCNSASGKYGPTWIAWGWN